MNITTPTSLPSFDLLVRPGSADQVALSDDSSMLLWFRASGLIDIFVNPPNRDPQVFDVRANGLLPNLIKVARQGTETHWRIEQKNLPAHIHGPAGSHRIVFTLVPRRIPLARIAFCDAVETTAAAGLLLAADPSLLIVYLPNQNVFNRGHPLCP
jgi:hypothetical protein